MTAPLRLILFDVDGTLVDSQGTIVQAMTQAFMAKNLPVPPRDRILSIVGLSLPRAMERLAAEQPPSVQEALVSGYRSAYHDLRLSLGGAHSPLYPGALEVLEHLHAVPDYLLGVATGKSLRGLQGLIEVHGLDRFFVTRQVADHHPSKPHPSMIDTARAETGVEAAHTVMIGDTSFDMDMAAAAGVAGIGVGWGYHATSALTAARVVIDRFEDLPAALDRIWN